MVSVTESNICTITKGRQFYNGYGCKMVHYIHVKKLACVSILLSCIVYLCVYIKINMKSVYSIPRRSINSHIMQCVRSVLMNKIVSSEKDLVGVVFYGTVSHG